jgi:endonuclease YncB( thermonuclease family)
MVKVIPFKARTKSSSHIRSILKKLRTPRSRTPRWRRYAISCVVAISVLIIFGAFLPKVTGPRSVITPSTADVRVIDGDTVFFKGKTYRLVGFDTPEISRAKCDSERARGVQATVRLRALITSGDITFQEVRCSCVPGTEGTPYCNFGRLCGILQRDRENVGDILIRERLARPFHCGEFRCPRRPGWC